MDRADVVVDFVDTMSRRSYPPEVAISHILEFTQELQEHRSVILVLAGYHHFVQPIPVWPFNVMLLDSLIMFDMLGKVWRRLMTPEDVGVNGDTW